jgi:glycerol kinase
MVSGLILAIDQGTTNTKALLVERYGAPVFRASAPVGLIHTEAGYVEQDPRRLWVSVSQVIAECVVEAARLGSSIEAVAISNQRETAVAWDAESGEAIANAISWQCPRSEEICRRLSGHGGAIRARTGLPLATLITAGKWAWLLENEPRTRALAEAGTLRLGTVDSWIVHRLTGGAVHATDWSNASRTGLLNLERLAWDDDLLALFGIPSAAMPAVRSSSGSFGVCSGVPGLEGVPILAAIGDSHAAMFGHGTYTPGTVKATYGTGSSLMALTAGLAADTPVLARTIAWSIDGETQFALEGNIAMTGSAVQWVGEFLNLADPALEAGALAATVPDADGVYFVPAMVGLGAPYWDAAARGTITGLGRSHRAAHLARAAVEAIAFQVADVFCAMEQAAGERFPALYADGGATRNRLLIQFQADILGRPVRLPGNEELSALGAAWLAGLGLGWWSGLEEISALPRAIDEFSPDMPAVEREGRCAGWKMAVARARLQAEARG